ncbi:hypothetical protein J132_07372 [Termitomyces sp. J132]|nr:hypothetical protein J132_07372 [Termitomyces sp. J132]
MVMNTNTSTQNINIKNIIDKKTNNMTLKLLNTKNFIDLIDDTIKTRDFNNQTLNMEILIKIIKAIATIITRPTTFKHPGHHED